jgi:hypothetical protein
MPVGFECRNANLQTVVMVDATYANMIFKQRIDVFCATRVFNGSFYYTDITVSQKVPILGLWAADPNIKFFYTSVQVNATTWTHRICACNLATGAGSTVSVYLFDTADTVDPGNFGINVFNAAGAVTFSTNVKYMRVVGAVSGREADSDPAWQSGDTWPARNFPLSGIQKPLIVQNAMQSYATLGDGGVPGTYSLTTFIMCGSTQAGQARLGFEIFTALNNLTNQPYVPYQPSYSYVFLDAYLLD